MTQRTAEEKIVGIVVEHKGRLEINACNRKKSTYFVTSHDLNGAEKGDVVVLEPLARGRKGPKYRVGRILGKEDTPGIFSLISLYEKGLSQKFSQAAMREAQSMTVPDLADREDFRNIPLVTIDGPTSRDFDDAVFAEPTQDGGHHLIVAIADVSWYVMPGSKLDKEAYERGNSTYFADRVLPMLPEGISNDLCSLRPHEDRACMAIHIWIDKEGDMTNYQVTRGLMRSAARLTYEQVQAAKDGNPDAMVAPLMDTVINPIYAAYDVLRQAREKRGALNIDMPEYKVIVAADGTIEDVRKSKRVDSMKVIEEFMVKANVAAATALESKDASCVYRTHEPPLSSERLNKLRDILEPFGLVLPEGKVTAADLKSIAEQAAGTPHARIVSSALLRVQAKAKYQTENIGHFGLALERYAHFTSPIRRYADLLVHRSLADAFNLGKGGLSPEQAIGLSDMAAHITETEIKSSCAERGAHDRFTAAVMAKHIGEEMKGRITAVSTGGLAVVLEDSGAYCFLPTGNLPKDRYDVDETARTMTGRDNGRVYSADTDIIVRIKESSGIANNIILEAVNDNKCPTLQNAIDPRVNANKNRGPRR